MITTLGVWSMIIVGQGSWDDVKVGDCLDLNQVTQLSGVEHYELYSPQQCDDDLPLDEAGGIYQDMACGLEVKTGDWTIEAIEHKQAGVYFPRRPPCMRSTKSAVNNWVFYDPTTEMPQCSEDELQFVFEQTEVYETKAYSAGQGKVYLPQPLSVKRRSLLEIGEDFIESCNETKVWLEYTGWGRIKGRLEEWNCEWSEDEDMSFCRDGKFALGETKSGDFCLEVKKWDDCLPPKQKD